MTRIAFYEARAFNPDNEAVHVTTSASPAEALSHRSALGMALYGAARTLGILAYPGQHEGVVFEGNLPTIDSLRPELRFLAPEIAQRALANCTSGRENAGGLSQLTRVVEEFGAPLDPEKDSFRPRMERSIDPFADATTWDGCLVHRYNREYMPPLDHEITKITYERYHTDPEQGTELLRELEEADPEMARDFKTVGYIDGVPTGVTVMTALDYYLFLRASDPELEIKARAANSRQKNKRLSHNQAAEGETDTQSAQ